VPRRTARPVAAPSHITLERPAHTPRPVAPTVVIARLAARALVLAIMPAIIPAVPAARAQPGCTAPPPQVSLTTTFADPVLDTSLDLAALRRLPRGGASSPRGSGHLLGLTSYEAVGSFTVDYATPLRAPGAPLCGAAQAVRLRLGFEHVVVRIAREVTTDRCLYDAVSAHENRHVQVDRDMLTQYARWFETTLRTQVALIGAVSGGSLDAIAAVIQRRIQAAFNAAFRDFQQELARRQREVDSPGEYRRLSAICGGAGGRLIAAARR
jgi:hypothetical protein